MKIVITNPIFELTLGAIHVKFNQILQLNFRSTKLYELRNIRSHQGNFMDLTNMIPEANFQPEISFVIFL